MNAKPTRETVAGRAYLDLQNLARASGRPTDELHQLYALEGFLERLIRSPHVDRFVLKGAMLLAAFDTRRPTRDVDLAARSVANDVDVVCRIVAEVAAVDVADGLTFDAAAVRGELIRDADIYSGVRVTLFGRLSSARVQFHVDVNVGDPITPDPETVRVPRILGGELVLAGYPIELVFAEKIVTAVQRGRANTRWRDFVDIARLAATLAVDGDRLAAAVHAVAEHRMVTLLPLGDVLTGFGSQSQEAWSRWRTRYLLADTTPEVFEDLLTDVAAFADPILTGEAPPHTWDSTSRAWT